MFMYVYIYVYTSVDTLAAYPADTTDARMEWLWLVGSIKQ